MKSKRKRSQAGQALVEYVFIFLFSVMLIGKAVQMFSEFFRDSMGNLGHVVSMNLMTGVCPENCWYDGYRNTFKGR
jgi:hypothetical protein